MDKQSRTRSHRVFSAIRISALSASLVRELLASGRYATARAYSSSVRRVLHFSGDEGLCFSSITPEFLKRYEQHLLCGGCRRNTVSLYLRMLRALCNRASRLGLARFPSGLFDEVFTGTDSSSKRAIPTSSVKLLRDADLCSNPGLEQARDFFMLSFYLRGIPFVDLVHLRHSDLSSGMLRYRRSKTGSPLTVKIEPEAASLIRKYSSRCAGSSYLLPVITCDGASGYLQYQSALRRYNESLGELSRRLHLKVRLTSYVARHSWATAAYQSGIPVTVISESLGHASEKVTYTYLAGFNNHTLSLANRKVIGMVTQPGCGKYNKVNANLRGKYPT
jgi:integrase